MANKHTILCDGLVLPAHIAADWADAHILNLSQADKEGNNNLAIKVKDFSQHLIGGLSNRIKDLLEIAGFVYGADRLIKRGETRQVEYLNWSRNMLFCIPVRDIEFWSQPKISKLLSQALVYVSGDKSYSFFFAQKQELDLPNGLFDVSSSKKFLDSSSIDISYEVGLFSGGLDSLAGIIELLETTNGKVVVTSHRANPKTIRTQKAVYEQLEHAYPGRLRYHPLECNIKGERASEETQRTRFFLYTSVGFALANVYGQNRLNIFENGITSINLGKRQDLINSRASRTTHPQTLALLQELYTEVHGSNFEIKHPYLYHTKTDVVNTVKRYGRESIIASTVTCTKTFLAFNNHTQASHCGYCTQCVDRRFAIYAAGLESFDAVYDFDLASESFPNSDARTHVIDYISHIKPFATLQLEVFFVENLEALADLTIGMGATEETEEVERLHALYHRHSRCIELALRRMAEQFDSYFSPRITNSLYSIVNDRPYLRDSAELLAEVIANKLTKALPIALYRTPLTHENQLNDHINSLLVNERKDYEREYPAVRFSIGIVVPDHSITSTDKELFVEAKYLRRATAPSKITDELGADLIKCPQSAFKLFVLYDPERRISDEDAFKRDFEVRGDCKVCVIR